MRAALQCLGLSILAYVLTLVVYPVAARMLIS
jgi:hypothetical protein